MKKIFLFIFSLLLCFSFNFNFVLGMEEGKQTIEKQAQIIDENIVVDDGRFDVEELQEEIDDKVSKEYLDFQVELLEIYNNYADDGMISITKNGTIIIEDDDSYYIQGGNVNKVVFNTKGVKVYKSKNKTKKMIKGLKGTTRVSSVCATVAEGTGIVAGTVSVIYSVGFWILEKAFSSIHSMCVTIINKSTKANKGNYGIILSMYYNGISAKAQFKNTK